MTVTELKPEIGVEITGIHGHNFVNADVAADCLVALDKHGVVVYREANIDDDDLVAFSRLLGQVEVRKTNTDAAHAEIFIVSRDPELSTSAAVQAGSFSWHIDGTTSEFPHKATLLTCREVALDDTGDTEFANTYAAYDALPDDDKTLLDGLNVEYGYANKVHRSIPGLTAEAHETLENVPPKVRHLVWARQSGRKSMLLGSTANAVVGWSFKESEALLDRILEWATQPRFVLRHHWYEGDLVIWDNTGMLHRAHPYDETSRRLMHRTALVGTESVA
jgi:alpha-ketoglutarate-dependent taurine dioxygenase